AVVGRTINQWFKDNPDRDLETKMRGTRPNCPNPRSIRVLPPPESEADQKLGSPSGQKPYSSREQPSDGQESDLIAVPLYRARPVDGVWATAPYLHNGSVPTLMDMLMPQDERPKAFCVGSRQFDPVKVGLRTPSRDDSGKPKPAADVTCESGLTKFDARELGN